MLQSSLFYERFNRHDTQYPSSRATRYILPGEFYGEQIEKLREANADLAKEG